MTGRLLYIDRTFKKTYTKSSDRSVETCEAYRRGEPVGFSLFFFNENDLQISKKYISYAKKQ